jgi:hypothetical protein
MERHLLAAADSGGRRVALARPAAADFSYFAMTAEGARLPMEPSSTKAPGCMTT